MGELRCYNSILNDSIQVTCVVCAKTNKYSSRNLVHDQQNRIEKKITNETIRRTWEENIYRPRTLQIRLCVRHSGSCKRVEREKSAATVQCPCPMTVKYLFVHYYYLYRYFFLSLCASVSVIFWLCSECDGSGGGRTESVCPCYFKWCAFWYVSLNFIFIIIDAIHKFRDERNKKQNIYRERAKRRGERNV